MTDKSVFIIGAGAEGRVVRDILIDCELRKRLVFIDDNPRLWGRKINGTKVAGGVDYLLRQRTKKKNVVISLGNPQLKRKLVNQLTSTSYHHLNVIHPTATIASSAKIGVGNIVGAQAVINSNVQLGSHNIINTGVIVEHDCKIDDYVSISPGALISGRVSIKEEAFIATGSVVLPRIEVGTKVVVAAGAVVTRDVPERTMVKGVPAVIVEKLSKKFDWKRVL